MLKTSYPAVDALLYVLVYRLQWLLLTNQTIMSIFTFRGDFLLGGDDLHPNVGVCGSSL